MIGRFSVIALLVAGQMAGCSTLDGIREVRDIAKPTDWTVFSREGKGEFWYDQSVRGFRHVAAKTNNQDQGQIVRDQLGKKVQKEEELIVLRKAHPSNVMGTGSKVATGGGLGVWIVGAVVETIILLPCVLAFNLVKDVLVLPFLPVASSLKSTYVTEAENSYVRGRQQFEIGQFSASLASWDRAQEIAPSLLSHSDIDYWRGKSFSALHMTKEAVMSYATFLSYSDSSAPEYFEARYASDATWERKAEEAESYLENIKSASHMNLGELR